MLRRSRVSGKMDMGRLGAGLARPGMDTRCWLSTAIALGESAVDAANGVFVDVQLLPSEEEFTARVPAIYAGNGFGLYAKIHKDDELVIAVPTGDPAAGALVIARPWSAVDAPPALAQANPDDLILVTETDKNLRIQVQGQGQVFIESAVTVTVNCPDIRLGDLAPSDYAALAQKVLGELNNVKADLDGVKSAFDGHTHVLAIVAAAGAGGTGTAAPPASPAPAPHAPQTVACMTTKVK